MGVTDKVKKLRAASKSPVVLGQWHESFSKVKKFADDNKVPMLAVWSNGDLCGHCIMFENCILDSKFKTWMKTSGVAFWIGFSSDGDKDNKVNGSGYNFAWGPKKALKQYPFVRLYWKSGKVDVIKTGDDLDGGTSKGAAKVVKALQGYLKSYKPKTAEDEKPKNDTSADDACDNCNPTNEGECNNCEPEFKVPTLAASKDKDGTFSVTVDGKAASGLTEQTAKYIVEAYNKGKA